MGCTKAKKKRFILFIKNVYFWKIKRRNFLSNALVIEIIIASQLE
jgi:hypothetical protein